MTFRVKLEVLRAQIVSYFRKFVFDEVLIVKGSEDGHGHVVYFMFFIIFQEATVFIFPPVWLAVSVSEVNLTDRKLVNHDLGFHVFASFQSLNKCLSYSFGVITIASIKGTLRLRPFFFISKVFLNFSTAENQVSALRHYHFKSFTVLTVNSVSLFFGYFMSRSTLSALY
jgi:hypothetical protein